MESIPRPTAALEAEYQVRIRYCLTREQQAARLDGWLTHLRLGAFLLSLALALTALRSESSSTLWWWLAGLTFLAFVSLIAWHDRVVEAGEEFRQRRRINEEALARIARRWDLLPMQEVDVPAAYRATATDLDLFGPASLFQLVSTAHTTMGRETLRDWLLEPADAAEVLARNLAAREIAGERELREQLQLEARLLGRTKDHPERFVQWAEGDPWLFQRPWLIGLSRLMPAVGFVVGVLVLVGAAAKQAGGLVLLAIVVVNCLLSVFFTGAVHDLFVMLATRLRELDRYGNMFRLLADTNLQAPRLQSVRATAAYGVGAIHGLRQLGRYLRLAHRDQSALKFLARIVLQLTVLWDFHVLWLLERWQRRQGSHVRFWLQALGEFEALASLGQLTHDHPDWAFAAVSEEMEQLTGESLAHPLLPSAVRVSNDVTVGPPGTFLLVTGSNMSGKSTLLRAIGLNAVLAEAGAPVCALRLTMPPVSVQTSMRIRDSLTEGVSFFLAELKRLKQIVDSAEALRSRRDRRLLYLLDEILLGTNSRDRHLAVVCVLSHLLECGALGAVSTHDIALAEAPELRPACRAVHFRETLHGPGAAQPMTFDFRLQPGIATTANAMKLVEMVGLRS